MKKYRSIGINAVLNIIKQCCNILFPLVTYPYISRVLGTDSLGKYSFSDSIIQYFIMTATLGVSGYAIREGARIRENKERLNDFCSEILTINIIALLISYTTLMLILALVPKLALYTKIILILSINIISNVIGRDWINLIYEEYFYITLRYIFFQVLSLVLMFVFVKDDNDCIIYTVIMTVATSGAQIANVIYTRRYVPIRLTLSRECMHHIKPIMCMFCTSVATILYINSDVTILGFLRSDEEVGVYYIIGKIYTLIKTLINAIILVTVPRISYFLGRNEEKSYHTLLEKLESVLFTLVIPCVVGLFAISKDIILIIGGEKYLSGNCALKILSFALLFSVMGCFYAQTILIPNRKEFRFLIATIVSATMNITLNFVLIPKYGINASAFTTMMAEIVIVILCAIFSRDILKKIEYKFNFSIAVGVLAIVGVCFCVDKLGMSTIVETGLSILFSSIVYFSIQVIGKNKFMLELLKTILHKNSQ